jgi:hypothetical protein
MFSQIKPSGGVGGANSGSCSHHEVTEDMLVAPKVNAS